MRFPQLVISGEMRRYIPHIAIGAGVVVCAAIAYLAFGGKTQEHEASGSSQVYSVNSYCRVVSFNEKTKSGTAGPCLRCVTGTYTAATWTNCPVRQSSDKPGSVECGYNAGQTPTAINPETMCADTGGGQFAPSGGPQATIPAAGASGIYGLNTPNSTSVPNNPNDISGVTNPNDDSGRNVPYGDTTTPARVIQEMHQEEQRDFSGRITREAATIYIVACGGSGRQIYIYEYLDRQGFRAIAPPDWSHPLGGREFATYDEAERAGCGG